jgi:hypothetical protein
MTINFEGLLASLKRGKKSSKEIMIVGIWLFEFYGELRMIKKKSGKHSF